MFVCTRVCVDVFSQVSDSNGVLVLSKFDQFLREALKLPTAVYEGPSFGYTQTLARSCFPQQVNTHTHTHFNWLKDETASVLVLCS